MIPVNNEHQDLELFKRVKNSKYEYESVPTIIFKGRPANNMETRIFRVQKGVNAGSESMFVYSSNLPEIVDVGDHVRFLGKVWTVTSIGYYFDAARFVNSNCLSEKQIIDRCPKGLNIV